MEQHVDVAVRDLVLEYLEHEGLTESRRMVEDEAARNIRSAKDVKDIAARVRRALLGGDRDTLWSLWDRNLPAAARAQDPDLRRAEFFVQVFFAVFPVHPLARPRSGSPDALRPTLEEAKALFHAYLGTRGAELSQMPEFLAFYALPFVPDPREHPSFRFLFAPEWVSDLAQRLERLFLRHLETPPESRLHAIWRKHMTAGVDGQAPDDRLYKAEALAQDLFELCAELLLALEETRSGKKVAGEYLAGIQSHLMRVEGYLLSLHQDSQQHQRTPHRQQQATLSSSFGVQNHTHTPTTLHVREESSAVRLIKTPSMLAPLNYAKIKADLLRGSEARKGSLLQALRWRLKKSIPGPPRRALLQVFVANDVLSTDRMGPTHQTIKGLLRNSDFVRENTLRLINVLACDFEGRSYLLQHPNIVPLLCDLLREENGDTKARMSALGALQKFSLRRRPQSEMIEQDVIDWLVGTLEDFESLSEYSLEYSTALLMNLCLRTAGKHKCEAPELGVLAVLNDLLEHDNLQVRTYVNGTLYSILGLPSLREKALAMGMEETLKFLISQSNETLSRQLRYILERLVRHGETQDAPSDDEDEEVQRENEEDTQDVDEIDDGEDEMAEDGEDEPPGMGEELRGEELLCGEFLANTVDATREAETAFLPTPSTTTDRPQVPPTAPTFRVGREQPPPTDTLRPSTSFSQIVSRQNTTDHPILRPVTPMSQPPTQKESEINPFKARPKVPRTPMISTGTGPQRSALEYNAAQYEERPVASPPIGVHIRKYAGSVRSSTSDTLKAPRDTRPVDSGGKGLLPPPKSLASEHVTTDSERTRAKVSPEHSVELLSPPPPPPPPPQGNEATESVKTKEKKTSPSPHHKGKPKPKAPALRGKTRSMY